MRYRTYSGSGKYIGYGLRIETGKERTTIIVDIFNIIQNVRDTGIHSKVDVEQWKIAQGSKRQGAHHERGWPPCEARFRVGNQYTGCEKKTTNKHQYFQEDITTLTF